MGALTQQGSLCHLLRILDVSIMRHGFAEHFPERLFKSSYNQQLNSHDFEASQVAGYGYSLTFPSMCRYNMYINVHLADGTLTGGPTSATARCAGSMTEKIFKIIYSSPYASHETALLCFHT